MQEIKQWLETDGDYDTGINLYAKYGKFNSVLDLLRKQKLPQKLRNALQETFIELKKQASTHDAVAVKKTTVPIQNTATHPQVLSLNEERKTDIVFLEIDKKWKQLYAEFATIHARLVMKVEEDENNTEVISALVRELHKMREQLVEYWHQRDHFLAYGVLPDAPAKARKIKTKITQHSLQKLLSVRSNIASKKRALAQLQAQQIKLPGNHTLKTQITKKKKQLSELETLKLKLENGTA